MQKSSTAPGTRPEELQVHAHHKWARYESEEEEISEAEAGSHHLLSPVESDDDSGAPYDAKESMEEDDSFSLGHGVSPTMGSRSRPISIATVKRSSVATFVPEHHDHDNDNGDHDYDESDDMTGLFTPSTTPPMPSPLLVPQTCFVLPDSPDADMVSYYQSLLRNSIISDDGLDVEGEIQEATKIMYIAPPSRPCLISINHHPESTGRPVSPRRCSVRSARGSGRRTSRGPRSEREYSRKMSSTSSLISCSPERTKRYSTIIFRDPFRSEGEGEFYLSPPQMDSWARAPSPTERRSSSSRRSHSWSRENERQSETQADRGRPKTSGSGASLSDMPLRRPVPGARPATFYQQEPMFAVLHSHSSQPGRTIRSSSFNSVGTTTSSSSKLSSLISSPLTQNSSTTSLSSDSDRIQLIRHPKLSPSPQPIPLTNGSLPSSTTIAAAAAAAISHSRSESSYSDFGPGGSVRGSLTYPYMMGNRKSQMSAPRTSSLLSFEVDPESGIGQTSSGKEAFHNHDHHTSFKAKSKQKGLMGFRLGRKKRVV
ncbi:hypothetical protein VTN77DRAFT_7624 [Rasamsonia byssochlamydoides]|uniref:uncharacterized protein n=1 Tax=Rasamsonia byssochlamydoides TaxID=89139 RepID=UPI0037447D25